MSAIRAARSEPAAEGDYGPESSSQAGRRRDDGGPQASGYKILFVDTLGLRRSTRRI